MWEFGAASSSLKVAKGTKLNFIWSSFHDLYLLKAPCVFNDDKVQLAAASSAGLFFVLETIVFLTTCIDTHPKQETLCGILVPLRPVLTTWAARLVLIAALA